VDDQDRDANRGQIAAEVFQAGCDAAERGMGRCGDGGIKAVLPGLVADPAAAQEIDVVGAVQEGFIAAGRSATIRAVMPSKTLRSIPSGLSFALSRKGSSGATRTAALTRSVPWTAR
jgi:hypothetical protein